MSDDKCDMYNGEWIRMEWLDKDEWKCASEYDSESDDGNINAGNNDKSRL
jgi:hypothetical protein